MEAEIPNSRPTVEYTGQPTPEQTRQISALFQDYSHKNYQLRVLGIDKNDMAGYLGSNLRGKGPGELLLSRLEGRVGGLACFAPARFLSERFKKGMWCFRHLVATGDRSGELVSALLDASLPQLESKAEVVTARIAASDCAAVRALEDHDFRLISSEVAGVVRYEDGDPKIPRGFRVMPMWAKHTGDVAAIACSVHRYNRFAFDPRFDRGAVEAMYRHLIQNYANDETTEILVVVDDGEEVAGFIAYKVNHELEKYTGRRIGSLDFIGVREDAQSRGLGDLLNRCALSDLRRMGANAVTVQTLVNNYNALAILKKIGFRITSANLVLHRWFS